MGSAWGMEDLLDLTCLLVPLFILWYRAWDYVYYDILSKDDDDV